MKNVLIAIAATIALSACGSMPNSQNGSAIEENIGQSQSFGNGHYEITYSTSNGFKALMSTLEEKLAKLKEVANRNCAIVSAGSTSQLDSAPIIGMQQTSIQYLYSCIGGQKAEVPKVAATPSAQEATTKSTSSDKERNKEAQTMLHTMGFLKPKDLKFRADGDFGKESKKALMDYQKTKNVKQTGVLDDKTFKAMEADMSSAESQD